MDTGKTVEQRNNGGKQKLVSIIVPVYNGEAYLERCIKSLLSQTYQNMEIVIVDDGSTDSSPMLCDKLAAKNSRIRVFHIEEKGVSAARNMGIAMATGEYLTFVDVDDCPAADMVEHLAAVLEQTNSDVAGCSYREFHNDAEAADVRESRCTKAVPAEILSGREFMKEGILKSDTRCWSKLYKRQSIENCFFDEELTIGEDMLFLLRLAQKDRQFSRSDYKGYGYFINDKGAMMQSFKDSYMDQIICWQQALSVIEKEAPEYKAKAAAILLISTMLVVGKLSMLPADKRNEKREHIDRCFQLVKKYAADKKVFHQLDKGYKIKISVFCLFPYLYMGLYHGRKQRAVRSQELTGGFSCRKIN